MRSFCLTLYITTNHNGWPLASLLQTPTQTDFVFVQHPDNPPVFSTATMLSGLLRRERIFCRDQKFEKPSATMTCAFVLAQPPTKNSVCLISVWTLSSNRRVSFSFFKEAARLDRLTRLIMSRSNLPAKSTIVRLEPEPHCRTANIWNSRLRAHKSCTDINKT